MRWLLYWWLKCMNWLSQYIGGQQQPARQEPSDLEPVCSMSSPSSHASCHSPDSCKATLVDKSKAGLHSCGRSRGRGGGVITAIKTYLRDAGASQAATSPYNKRPAALLAATCSSTCPEALLPGDVLDLFSAYQLPPATRRPAQPTCSPVASVAASPAERWRCARCSDDRMRQAVKDEVQEELRAEFEYKQMETEADCVAQVVAVQMSCTNKISVLAQAHHVGLESIKQLVKAKGGRLKKAVRQEALTAYKAGFKAGYNQGAASAAARLSTSGGEPHCQDPAQAAWPSVADPQPSPEPSTAPCAPTASVISSNPSGGYCGGSSSSSSNNSSGCAAAPGAQQDRQRQAASLLLPEKQNDGTRDSLWGDRCCVTDQQDPSRIPLPLSLLRKLSSMAGGSAPVAAAAAASAAAVHAAGAGGSRAVGAVGQHGVYSWGGGVSGRGGDLQPYAGRLTPALGSPFSPGSLLGSARGPFHRSSATAAQVDVGAEQTAARDGAAGAQTAGPFTSALNRSSIVSCTRGDDDRAEPPGQLARWSSSSGADSPFSPGVLLGSCQHNSCRGILPVVGLWGLSGQQHRQQQQAQQEQEEQRGL